MSTSVVPAVIDALVALADAALTGVTVHDAFGVSSDPGDYLMVGVQDPNDTGVAVSAESSQSFPHVGYRTREEVGGVWCTALSWNGDADQKAARDAVYATVAAVEDLLRDDPTLGLAATSFFVAEFGSTSTLRQDQDKHGASAEVSFQVAFKARI